MADTDTLPHAPEDFRWPRCPEAEAFIQGHLDNFLVEHTFAGLLSRRMAEETSTRFFDWVDHIVLPAEDARALHLGDRYGYVPDEEADSEPAQHPYWHPFAQLPRLLLDERAQAVSVAIHVDRILDFQAAHGLSRPVAGEPLSTYRRMKVPDGQQDLIVVERRGTRDYVPDATAMADRVLHALEDWANRPRQFDDEVEGMVMTRGLAGCLAGDLGRDLAAWVFLEGERMYWQARNRAGRIQKFRQDALGLGWANHDHHTFRSSRRHFRALIDILSTFGFLKRERFYAGAEAGWGAQVMEQPSAGLVIFADVDLRPDELDVDFSDTDLEPLEQLGTVGLWCALHGESILQAGMHHLEAQFQFDELRRDLAQHGIETMAPFSDFEYLKQAFTVAERWPVDPERLESLRQRGALDDAAAAAITEKGGVGSHLENLQRREGFKGFNQSAVNKIIEAVHPGRQALGDS